MSFRDVLLSSVEDSKLLAGRDMNSLRSNLVHHLVNESRVSESSSSHDLIVATSSTVGVEVLRLDVTLIEVSRSRGVLSDHTSR